MDIKDLTFGVGLILRENIDDWETSESGTPYVFPDHPPLDLSKSSYPRATVDIIGHNPDEQSVEKDAFFGEPLMDLTVYAVNSGEVSGILGDCIQAVIDNWDGTDSEGNPYLEEFAFERAGMISEIQAEQTEKGFTRYNKTVELEFTSVTTKS